MIRHSGLVLLLIASLSLLSPGSIASATASEGTVLQKPVTLDVRDLDVQRVLKEVAAQSGVSLVPSREVRGTLSLQMKDVSLKEVLTTVCSTVGCEWVLSDGPTLVVFPPGPEERIARMNEELRELGEQRAEPKETEPLRLCTSGDQGRIEILDVGGAASPTVIKRTDGIFRIWK